MLNHAGVCTAYGTAWGYLQKLSTEARFLSIIRSGYWMWIFDNLNIHQTIRHEREGL